MKGDTSSLIYSYTYVLPDKVLEFNYSDDEIHDLINLYKWQDNKETIYFPVKPMMVEPGVQNFDSVLKKREYASETSVTILDSTILAKITRTDNKGQKYFEHMLCYKMKRKHSFFSRKRMSELAMCNSETNSLLKAA